MSYSDGRMLLSSQREGQISRFRAWVMVLVPLVAILFQVYIPLFFPFLKFLDMPLLVVIYFALMRRSQISGLFAGAAVGLAQDSLSKNPLGLVGIVNTLVGYIAASVAMRFDVESGVLRLFLSWIFYFFHQFLYWVLERALLGHMMSLEIRQTLVLGVLNAIVAVPLFMLLDKLRERT
jgi:rod shape-determining protein MreD